MLSGAYHLHTKTTPKIYYRPYLLLPEQSTLIDEQVADAQAQLEAQAVDAKGVSFLRRDSLGRDVKPEDVLKESDSRDSTLSSPKDVEDERCIDE